MIAPDEIRSRIQSTYADAEVNVRDLTGGGDHYQVEIVSTAFDGKLPLERHRMIYAIFDDVMGGALHALSLKTKAPGE